MRYAKTHGPFTTEDITGRFGLLPAQGEPVLTILAGQGRLIAGEFDPRGSGPEWCDKDMLRRIKRGTLNRLRDKISPVAGDVLGRFLLDWHGIDARKASSGFESTGPDSSELKLDRAIDLLEGLPLSFAELERSILPARLPNFDSRMLDERGALGQLVWVGCRVRLHQKRSEPRGVLVEAETRGNRTRFTCPFHAWTYSNKGELVGLPKAKHFGEIDKSCNGLIPLPAVERYGFLWVHPDPKGEINVEKLLGELASEFDTWGFAGMKSLGDDTYTVPLNWKLAMDTFGETYHFTTLHRDTLAESFYGNVQCYDVYGRNHRMILCMKAIDELRDQPEANWNILAATLPVYYLFPNIQVNVLPFGVALVRAYPDPTDPGKSTSQISFYVWAEASEEQYEQIKEIMQDFSGVIRDEDYAVAARSQLGANSGVLDTVRFGRNEPALHHYHNNTYRRELGMEPVPLLEN